GMLGIGLMLTCLRALSADRMWRERLVAFAFWAMNLGVMAQIVLSLLPVGLLQTDASVQHGYWYAPRTEFLHTPPLPTFRWLPVRGDTLFAAGAFALVWFVFGLRFGGSLEPVGAGASGAAAADARRR